MDFFRGIGFKWILNKSLLLLGLFLMISGTIFAAPRLPLSPEALIWADSVYSRLSLEQKVSLLFMVDVRGEADLKPLNRIKYQPAFYIGAVDGNLHRNNRITTDLFPFFIPDIDQGFDTGIPLLPFPDHRTLQFMEPHNRQKLIPFLRHWLKTNQFQGFYSANQSLWNPSGDNGLPDCLVFPVGGEPELSQALTLNGHEIPKALMRLAPSCVLPQYRGDQWGIVKTPVSQLLVDNIQRSSVEQFLQQGSLLVSDDYENDFSRMVKAFENRLLNTELLEQVCKRVLAVKYEAQNQYNYNAPGSTDQYEAVLRKAYESAVGLFQAREDSPFPLVFLNLNVGFLTDGNGYFDEFRTMAGKHVKPSITPLDAKEYDMVFWLAGPDFFFRNSVRDRLNEIKERFPGARIILVRTGSLPENLPYFLPDGLDALIYAPSNLPVTWQAMAQVAFNGIETNEKRSASGIMDSLTPFSKAFPVSRLKFGIPEEVGLNRDSLALIDDVVEDAIRKSAMPGAQVLVAHKGVVVYNQSFGWSDYDKTNPVTDDVVYDLASVTKVMATMPVLMQQYDHNRWRLSDRLADFIPGADTTDKRSITLRQLLLHESGLPAFISFYTQTIDTSRLVGNIFSNRRSITHPIRIDKNLYFNKTVVYRDDVFRSIADLDFSVPVAPDMFMNVFYRDSMLHQMLRVRKAPTPKYVYSDVNFLFLQRIIENLAQESLDKIAANQFYKPMGALRLCFNPWKTVPLNKVAPTETEMTFRRQLLLGYVHDHAAAMMGGVAGHAGLFGNATDLAKMLQMYLNTGLYGGYRYLKDETIDFFTARQDSANRRGLGFDKPEWIDREKNNTFFSPCASARAYGHTGFTGTMVLVDPQYDLLIVFLSNRVHPYSFNNKLSELDVRLKIQNIVYRNLIYSENKIERLEEGCY